MNNADNEMDEFVIRDLSTLTSLSPSNAKEVIQIFIDLFIHSFSSINPDDVYIEDSDSYRINIRFPLIGNGVLLYKDDKFTLSDFEFDKEISDSLSKALFDGKSPLIDRVTEKLKKSIENNFKSLL